MLIIPIVNLVLAGTPSSEPTVDVIDICRCSHSRCEMMVVAGRCLVRTSAGLSVVGISLIVISPR
eukprot:4090678-Amphidinium_carterae.1